ncbi:hypothetical protein ACX9I7_28690 [Streptomyces sp. L500]|uniref:hypothetical protein n=1 Tax=Streptomyces abikoensis TaxID=97398 RepID=UPI0036AEA509
MGTSTLTVTFAGGESYRVSSHSHGLTVGQPLDAGGTGLGPTPVDLFVTSPATRIAFYAPVWCSASTRPYMNAPFA